MTNILLIIIICQLVEIYQQMKKLNERGNKTDAADS